MTWDNLNLFPHSSTGWQSEVKVFAKPQPRWSLGKIRPWLFRLPVVAALPQCPLICSCVTAILASGNTWHSVLWSGSSRGIFLFLHTGLGPRLTTSSEMDNIYKDIFSTKVTAGGTRLGFQHIFLEKVTCIFIFTCVPKLYMVVCENMTGDILVMGLRRWCILQHTWSSNTLC